MGKWGGTRGLYAEGEKSEQCAYGGGEKVTEAAAYRVVGGAAVEGCGVASTGVRRRGQACSLVVYQWTGTKSPGAGLDAAGEGAGRPLLLLSYGGGAEGVCPGHSVMHGAA